MLKIDDGYNEMMQTYFNSQKYDISFSTNRVTYQLQHEALKYMRHHRLFDLLINNPEYKNYSVGHEKTSVNIDDNKRATRTLNEEQNLAVHNILMMSDPMPFLLFGPPGSLKLP